MNEFIEIFGVSIPYIVFQFFIFSVVFFLVVLVFYYLYPMIHYYLNRSDNDDYFNVVSKNFAEIPDESLSNVTTSKPERNYVKPNPKAPYSLNRWPLTDNSQLFYNALLTVIKDKYYAFPEISLISLVWLHPPKTKNRIKQIQYDEMKDKLLKWRVDFVIFDKRDFWPLLAIEVDDRSHNKTYRKDRDSEVEKIFKDIGLPLYRTPSHSNNVGYSVSDIRKDLSQYLPDI